MKPIEKEKIVIGLRLNILGSDGELYPVTIVADENWKDEDEELGLTEAFHYQHRGELFEIKTNKMRGVSIAVSFGKWGGFYFHNGYSKRLCLGWMAITYFPEDIDGLFKRLIEKND